MAVDFQDQRTAWVILEEKDGDFHVYQEKTIGITHKGSWIVTISTRAVAVVESSAIAEAIIAGKDLEPESYVTMILCGKNKSAKCRIERAKQPVTV